MLNKWRTKLNIRLVVQSLNQPLKAWLKCGVRYQGRIQRFWKRGALYVYVVHHGWPMKKILGLRWSKKAKIMLETKAFGKTSLSVFSNFLHFLYINIMKACRWNLINFSRFTKAFVRKEKKQSYSSQWEKKNWKNIFLFNRLFYEALENGN